MTPKDDMLAAKIVLLAFLMLAGATAGGLLYGWRGFFAGACITFVFMNGTAQT